MKDVKIVIGANYGDEGKGLMTRHFVKEAKTPAIVVFHNGTAQRGHTVDYSDTFRHVYHHFGSGTGDGAPTYFAESFLIHPMEFHREFGELCSQNIFPPKAFCDPNAKVITPLDMVVDHATEEFIAIQRGEREYGSCGYGSWCAAEDRIPMGRTAFTISDFLNKEAYPFLMEEIWKDCLAILVKRGVDIERTSFAGMLKDRTHLLNNFRIDLNFFFSKVTFMNFDGVYNKFDSIIFENGQGLGLDMNVNNPWHTTSNTGLANPFNMLEGKNDFSAEACYVTRSYLTRHGVGPLEEEVVKTEINAFMCFDKTNVHNHFQGSLRYGFLEDNDQKARIAKDWAIVGDNTNFKKSMAITHCNEFDCETEEKYFSETPFEVHERK